jgi:site-specific DNA recombinase
VRPKTVRCAIYTRKSTEHNLDLEFNSLHAQREACEAYIKSQMHEGWLLIPDPYDDGAFSGASLDRPDLQRLLGDIAAGRVDIVVVYKVDRLTRSLTDFARLVELFDKHGVSFISVTQAFNTTTSMGRLTLNVLLSFAQFEREMIGERVRDKIAASKKKGLFMGGGTPIGYTNRDKKLVIVPEEAERVRWIFKRYLELGSIAQLLEEMYRLNIRTRIMTLSDGRKRGGVFFSKGNMAYLLRNRCYVGEILHKGQIHAADHEPIIDRATFDAVQASFAARKVARRARAKVPGYLLAGLLFDSAGNRMSPCHTRKKGVRYRYYLSQAILQSRKDEAGHVVRVPAPDIERVIERFVRIRYPAAQGDLQNLIETQIARVTVAMNSIDVELAESIGAQVDGAEQRLKVVSLPWSKKPFRAQKGVIFDPGVRGPAQEDDRRTREAILISINKARHWVDELLSGRRLAEIARDEGCTVRHSRNLVQLAFVSPNLVKAIMDDNGPPGLTATGLQRMSPLWHLQEERYLGGIASMPVNEEYHLEAHARSAGIAASTAI